MAEIELDYAVPSADMVDYITLFYNFRADVPVFEDTERADHAQLRFGILPGTATYCFADDSTQEAGDLQLIGPTSGATRVRAEGPIEVFGMGLTAAGWAAVVRSNASSMINRVVDAGELLGPAVRETLEALRRTHDFAGRVVRGEALVRALIADVDGSAVAFMRQVDDWLGASASPEIDDLVRVAGLSRRQVERRCNALYGAPPKLLARKYRALRAVVMLVVEGADVDEAIGRGFYDQSHLIREVKQFTGFTPCQMRDDPTALAKLTIGLRHALNGKISPTISDT
ncbi:MAG: helix-turn-helix domain-containing protein [Sphingomonas sp.]